MTRSKARKQGRESAKKAVPFVVRGIEGQDVAVTGDFTGWSEDGIRLTRGVDGAWRTTLELAPGEYQVRLRVDGEWRDVPDAEASVPSPYGSENAILKVH